MPLAFLIVVSRRRYAKRSWVFCALSNFLMRKLSVFFLFFLIFFKKRGTSEKTFFDDNGSKQARKTVIPDVSFL